ncbi:hypothetical protein E4U25_003119 [Claviceps purpurea]|nr:hypothetical protein E4U25_003119 [Claviceps purpurea]
MGDAPPPPPPPHGSAPRSSSGLPPGKYDIFVIPQHSAGSGFLYLPSMKPNVNSFIAGFASALILVAVFQSMAPAFRAWWESFQGLGNMGITLLIIGVGFGAWALGRTQHDGPSSSSHYQSSYSGAGGGAGYTPGGFGDSASGPSSPGGQPHAGPPPRPPPHASPPPHGTGAGGGPPPQTRPQTPPPATVPPQPPPPTSQPPPTSPPPPQPQPQPPPPTSPPLTTQPPPMQEEKPKTSSQRPNPQPTTPKSPTPRSAWEKAREETRKKEEERKLKEAEQKRREEAVKRLAELRAKEAKERQEREKEKQLKEKEAHDKKLKEQAEQRRKELMEKLRREREEKAKEEEKRKEAAAAAATTAPSTPAGDNATRVGSTYAFSSVGEKTSMWPNGRPPSQAKSTPSSPTKKPPSPEKRPPNPTARSFVSTAPSDSTYSFRPYDDPKRTRRRQTSMSSLTGSDTSWAQSQTTSRTSPPPSVRGSRGPYTTKDPDKIVIQAVYLFMNEYAKTPASQLVSGVGSVTDGLILRITTEGLFIDDDVRGVPQREWDVKAWTLKLAEVWCPPHCLNSASASASATASGGAPKSAPHLLFKMATAARKAGGDRDGGNKILTGAEADSYLGDMLRTCKECCRLGLCDATLRNSSSLSAVSAGWKQKGLHVLRATIRDQEGKRYMFVMSERESWKLAYGLQRLRGGTQVRQLGVAGMTAGEARGTLEMLGWG